jgi:hypothetical protein
MIFGVMRLMCVLLFTVSIPLLVLLRFKHSKFPARLLIMLATSMGWLLPYAYMSLRAPTDFEITHFFSLRAEERSAVLTRYRDSLRLGAALQISLPHILRNPRRSSRRQFTRREVSSRC